MLPLVGEIEGAADSGAAGTHREGSAADDVLGRCNQNPVGLSLWQLWQEDLRTHDGNPFEQGFWAVALHRFGNWRMDIRPRIVRAPFSLLYNVLFKIIECASGISLCYSVKLGRRVRIWHHGGIILSARAIGDDVHIRQNTTLGVAHRGAPLSQRPVIQDGVDVGCGAVILGGVTVGHHSQIGANSVVLKDIPPYSVAVGAPARVVKSRLPGTAAGAPAPRRT